MPHLDKIPLPAIIVGLIVWWILNWARKHYCPVSDGMKGELNLALSKLRQLKGPLDVATFKGTIEPLFTKELPKLKSAWQEYREMLDIPEEENGIVSNFRQAEHFINKEVIFDSSINTELFHAIPGIVTAIGLLGTFISLFVALAGLSFNPDHLPIFISQLSGKFLCSIIGVAGAIYFLYIERRSNGEISQLFLELQNTLNGLMTHKSSETILKEFNKDIRTLALSIQNHQKDLSTAIPAAVRTGLQEALKEEIQHLREQTRGVLEQIRNSNLANQKELQELTVNFQNLISSTFNSVTKEAFQASKQQIQLLQEEVHKLTASVSAATEAAKSMNEAISSADQRIGDALAELNTGSQQINLVVSTTLGQMKTDLQTVSQSLQDSSTSLKSGVSGALDELGNKLNSSLQLLNGGLSNVAQNMNSEFDRATQRMQDGMCSATAEINQGFGIATDNLKTVLENLKEQNNELLTLRKQISQLIHTEMSNTLNWHQDEIKVLRDAQQQQFEAVIQRISLAYENLLVASEQYSLTNQQEIANTFEKIVSRIDFSNDSYANKLRSDVEYMVQSLSTWIETASDELTNLIRVSARETTEIKASSQSIMDLLDSLRQSTEKLNDIKSSLVPVVSDMSKAANSFENAGQYFNTALSDFRNACNVQNEMMTKLKDEMQFNALLAPVPAMLADGNGKDD